MREISPNVWQLGGFPPSAINVYLIGDVLIDAATRWAGRRILGQLGDRKLSLVALTHVHADHQGVACMICERYQIPLACHAADVPAMQGERPMVPDTFAIRVAGRIMAGPPYRVARILGVGDEIAGFRVVHAPGHTPGHIILFRDDDRVAIVGDVLNGMNLATAWPGLHEPPRLLPPIPPKIDSQFAAWPNLSRACSVSATALRFSTCMPSTVFSSPGASSDFCGFESISRDGSSC